MTDYEADALLHEIAQLKAQRDREHAATAALIEAVAAVADFVESYTPDSHLARVLPAFHTVFRVHGRNARAALTHARPQAEAMLAELEAARVALRTVAQAIHDYRFCVVCGALLTTMDGLQNDPHTADCPLRAYGIAMKARTE